MAEVLGVSVSGYYSYRKRKASHREKKNRKLLKRIQKIHIDSKGVYGSRKITAKLNEKAKSKVNHKRVERLMQENGIYAKVSRKYRVTTDSNHNLPVAENLLNREFETEEINQKMVSDISFIPTAEGWLYVAAIMDLCGNKIIGLSMSNRITKELVIAALEDAHGRSGQIEGCILHSDRGSQYCSREYREKLAEYGFVCIMSRSGDCWDNAPMESFWGKMKTEWLNEKHFQTREEAKAAVFEYIWIFYNRKRLHAANGYMTPEKYYELHKNKVAA